MVGLSVVLEAQKGGNGINKKSPQVINKTTMMSSTSSTNKPSPPSPPAAVSSLASSQHSVFQAHTFLDQCFLCRNRLLPGKDIYMYKGDRAFCSVDCRCKQIYTDEEEAIREGNCSNRKGSRTQAGGGFAYP